MQVILHKFVVLFLVCEVNSVHYFWIQGVTIQMKATEQYFPVVLFIMLYKVVLTFESVDEISHLTCTFQICVWETGHV